MRSLPSCSSVLIRLQNMLQEPLQDSQNHPELSFCPSSHPYLPFVSCPPTLWVSPYKVICSLSNMKCYVKFISSQTFPLTERSSFFCFLFGKYPPIFKYQANANPPHPANWEGFPEYSLVDDQRISFVSLDLEELYVGTSVISLKPSGYLLLQWDK